MTRVHDETVRITRRALLAGVAAIGFGALSATGPALAQTLDCPPPPRVTMVDGVEPANKKIGVSVAYLAVPFYANFKTGLEDGAKQFGFEYDLLDGNLGDVATELANLQNFATQGYDLVLLTPSGEGIIPGIKQLNSAGIPIVEVNNRSGFGRDDVEVVTYVGADDVEFGRLQAQLVAEHFKGSEAKVAYVMGFLSSPAQVLRAQGWDEERPNHPEINEIARVSDDFDSAKALAVTQDLLSRFPKGEIDAIVMQGPEGAAAVDFAQRTGRTEVKFFAGDYPADIRQLIHDGKMVGTVNQDPYPQAYHAMEAAYLHLMGRDDEIKKPNFLPLPLVRADNAEAIPPAWGC
ncbi:MAG: sugar ABC transporter substrate-binding protein [Hyphomicrobiales bacterium]|nr:sugar ABC transporter substrate-binding protein [Hyphomicrobiales bacterium]